jgi:hypothetical protein
VDALAFADEEHPAVARGRADVLRGEAERLAADSANDLLPWACRLNARWVDPSDVAPDQSHNDSQAILRLSKPLYDFGRTSHALEAADTALRSQRGAVPQPHGTPAHGDHAPLLRGAAGGSGLHPGQRGHGHRLRVPRPGPHRNELGQVSDIDLLALEDRFQETRLRRMASLQETRSARNRLAMALNRPDKVPADLLRPELPGNDRTLPELDELYALAEAGNRRLASLRLEAQAVSQRLAASRAGAPDAQRGGGGHAL